MASNIRYLAVAQNEKIVGEFQQDKSSASEDYRGTLDKIFTSAGWVDAKTNSKRKLELTSGTSIYCLEFDGEDHNRVVVAVVAKLYPTRYVFSSSTGGAGAGPRLMSEIREHMSDVLANSANVEKSLKKTFKNGGFLKVMAAKYDDLTTLDKLAATTKKVQDVKAKMAENMVLATERDSLLSGLEVKSDQLNASSRKMFETATAIKSKARRQCIKTYACAIGIIVGIILVLAAIILGVNYGDTHWWGGGKSSDNPPASSPSPAPGANGR